jgi:hypothetical protein
MPMPWVWREERAIPTGGTREVLTVQRVTEAGLGSNASTDPTPG